MALFSSAKYQKSVFHKKKVHQKKIFILKTSGEFKSIFCVDCVYLFHYKDRNKFGTFLISVA